MIVTGVVIAVVYVLLLLKDYKFGVIFAAMTIQFLSYIGTGFPGLRIFTCVAFLSIGLFFLNYRSFKGSTSYPKIFVVASLLFLVSFVVTEMHSRIGAHWLTIIANYGTFFLFPFLLWKSLDSEKRLNQAQSILFVFMIISVLFNIVELILGWNPVTDFVITNLTSEDFLIDSREIRYGLKRCNSIFSYFTTFGVASVFSAATFFVMKYNYQFSKKFMVPLIGFCAFGAFSTGSRAIFLGLAVMFLFLLARKTFFKSKLFYVLLIGTFILAPIIYETSFQIIDSIVNSNTSQYSTGSSSDMRETQWDICLPYILQSPVIGNGRLYIWEYVKPRNPLLLGAESIWFSIFVDYGLLGAFAFLFLLFAMAKELAKVDFRYISFPLAYLAILSLSPDQGVQYNVLITFSILILKTNEFKGNKNELDIE